MTHGLPNERTEIVPFDPWVGARLLVSERERLALQLAERHPARWYQLSPGERVLLGGLAVHIVAKHSGDEFEFGCVATVPYLKARLMDALRAAYGRDEARYGPFGHDLWCYRVEDPAHREAWSSLDATLNSLPLRDSPLLDELLTALVAARELERKKVRQPADDAA